MDLRVEELNDRIWSRNVPDKALAANYDPRPTSTKYSHFGVLDRRGITTVLISETEPHTVGTNFNPGTHRAPPGSIIRDVDIETTLRNQYEVLRHGDNYSPYVPSSNSDLYKVNVPSSSTGNGLVNHPNLFRQENHSTFRATAFSERSGGLGGLTFGNNTRVQLRNML